jgi:hypothetical protein
LDWNAQSSDTVQGLPPTSKALEQEKMEGHLLRLTA